MSSDTDYNRRNKVPRQLTESEKARLEEFIDSIHYSSRSVSALPLLATLRRIIDRKEGLINMHCRYSDNEYEYRHVQLPKNMLKAIPKEYHDPAKGTLKLLWEDEWRGLGITQVSRCFEHYRYMYTDHRLQSLGWEHYEVHEPEPHILLFK